MRIAINAVAAFQENRTGVEEYAYHLIKSLAQIDLENQFVLYKSVKQKNDLDFELPANFQIKSLQAPFLWSQTRLAAEMFLTKPDVLFVPAQVAPFLYTKNSVVTVHGLEYEYFPKQYPLWFRVYLRFFTKRALRNAKQIIAVSENTKKDLVKLYGGDAGKIKVIYHGIEIPDSKFQILDSKKYILYIGRIETKKNLVNLIKAFELFKDTYQLPYRLILIGGKGYGWQAVYRTISQSKYKNDILLTGFVEASKKLTFLKEADLFVFTSFYEGFGMPALEAMAAGVPVLSSSSSSLPEVCGDAAVLVDPHSIEEIAENMYNIVSDEDLKNDLIRKGFENVQKFSWKKCAEDTLKVIYESSNNS